MLVTSDEEEWENILVSRLKAGDRVNVITCSATIAEKLDTMIRHDLGVACRVYTGKPEHAGHKADFDPANGGVDAAWAEYQAVIFNGAVTVAIDPQGEFHRFRPTTSG